MKEEYVINVDGAYRIAGTRVSLDSVVYGFLEGLSPESIVDELPALSLDQVYGAIAFYLAHQREVDEYLRQGEADFEALRQSLLARNPLLYQKLAAHKRQRQSRIA